MKTFYFKNIFTLNSLSNLINTKIIILKKIFIFFRNFQIWTTQSFLPNLQSLWIIHLLSHLYLIENFFHIRTFSCICNCFSFQITFFLRNLSKIFILRLNRRMVQFKIKFIIFKKIVFIMKFTLFLKRLGKFFRKRFERKLFLII